jgi:hypothetical protein
MLVSAHANAVFEITFSALTATRTLFEDTEAVVLCLALLEPMISSLSIAFGLDRVCEFRLGFGF